MFSVKKPTRRLYCCGCFLEDVSSLCDTLVCFYHFALWGTEGDPYNLTGFPVLPEIRKEGWEEGAGEERKEEMTFSVWKLIPVSCYFKNLTNWKSSFSFLSRNSKKEIRSNSKVSLSHDPVIFSGKWTYGRLQDMPAEEVKGSWLLRRILLPSSPLEGELPASTLIFPGPFEDSSHRFLDWRSLTSSSSQVSDTPASDSENSEKEKSQQCNAVCEGTPTTLGGRARTTRGSNAGSPPNAG